MRLESKPEPEPPPPVDLSDIRNALSNLMNRVVTLKHKPDAVIPEPVIPDIPSPPPPLDLTEIKSGITDLRQSLISLRNDTQYSMRQLLDRITILEHYSNNIPSPDSISEILHRIQMLELKMAEPDPDPTPASAPAPAQAPDVHVHVPDPLPPETVDTSETVAAVYELRESIKELPVTSYVPPEVESIHIINSKIQSLEGLYATLKNSMVPMAYIPHRISELEHRVAELSQPSPSQPAPDIDPELYHRIDRKEWQDIQQESALTRLDNDYNVLATE